MKTFQKLTKTLTCTVCPVLCVLYNSLLVFFVNVMQYFIGILIIYVAFYSSGSLKIRAVFIHISWTKQAEIVAHKFTFIWRIFPWSRRVSDMWIRNKKFISESSSVVNIWATADVNQLFELELAIYILRFCSFALTNRRFYCKIAE